MKVDDLKKPIKQGAGCLLYIPESKKFLLIQRSEYVPAPLAWCLPGGGVDEGEDPIVTAKRELFEETQIDIGDRPLKLIYTNEYEAPRFKFHIYACIVTKELEPTLNWESVDYAWRTIDDLPDGLHSGVKQLFSHDIAAQKLKEFAANQTDS